MSNLNKAFGDVYDLLIAATEKQRERFSKAFGQANWKEIGEETSANCKQLEDWRVLLQELQSEMADSDLFEIENETVRKRARTTTVLSPSVSARVQNDFDPTGKRPLSVTIFGKKYRCTSWKELTIIIANALYDKKPHIIGKLNENPRLSNIFTKTDKGYRTPRKIKGGLYLETNRNATFFKSIWETMLEECGYSADDIEIEINNKELITV
jgi:hypothetical protein